MCLTMQLFITWFGQELEHKKIHLGPSAKDRHLETLREHLGKKKKKGYMLLTSSHFFARGCEEQHSSKSHLALIRGHQRPQFSSGSWSEIPSYSHQLHNKLAK